MILTIDANILTNIPIHLRLLVTLRYQFQYLLTSCMLSYLGIIVEEYNILVEIIDVQDVNPASKQKKTIYFYLLQRLCKRLAEFSYSFSYWFLMMTKFVILLDVHQKISFFTLKDHLSQLQTLIHQAFYGKLIPI